MKYCKYIVLIVLSSTLIFAKTPKNLIRKGNEQYKNKKFNDAEISYRKSLEIENNSEVGIFNLGDALYKQKHYDKAADEFKSITSQNISKDLISKAFHNLGNSLLKSGKLEQSIEAYKNSLKNNPNDFDTKYNLEYAKKLLKKQKQQKKQNKNQKNKNQDKKQQNKQQQNKQNQNKDNKNKKDNQKQQGQKNKQQQNKQQEQKQGQQGKKQDAKKQEGKQGKKVKISKKDAMRILQALNQEEKKLQKKLKKKVKGRSGKVEKQW